MKMRKIYESVYDILQLFKLRMKLIFTDRTTLFVLILSVFLFAWMLQVLSVSASGQSAIPIGIVDYDQSDSSRELIADLKTVPALRIVNEDEKKFHKLLLDEMITSYFVIKQGYEQNLKSGNLDEIITMYYVKDNKSASVISDIVAGQMMYPAGFYKSYNTYEKLSWDRKKHTFKEYEAYMNQLMKTSKDFDFAFQMNFVNPDKSEKNAESISNSILYNQFIFGILGILISFIGMFIMSASVSEKEMGVNQRLNISKFQRIKQDFGNLIALIFTEGIIAGIFTALIYSRLHIQNALLWISIFYLIMLYSIALGGVFLLLAKFIRHTTGYQLVCSIAILITGGMGFYHMLSGFYQSFPGSMIKFIPNNWFIQGLTDIILYDGTDGYFKDGHGVLLWMTISVILLIIISDLPWRTAMHKQRKSATER